MHKVIDANKKSEKLLKSMKKNVSELIEINNSTHKDFEKLNSTINKVHKELNDLEKLSKDEDVKENFSLTDEDYRDEINNMRLPKKITIKKVRKSKSFRNWFFNNLDL